MRNLLSFIVGISKWLLLILIFIVSTTILIVHFATEPSNNREWSPDQAILPHAEISTTTATIHNVRNFSYSSISDYTSRYYDKTIDLNSIKRVYYVVEPFAGFRGSAHTFLTFEYEDPAIPHATSSFIAVSIEIRKEKGEKFSAVKGLFNKYELMYVIADERDVVKLRSNYRKDLVYVYPIKTTPEASQRLFVDMLQRANTLKEKPEFYNTLTNTCTTNIVYHVNNIWPGKASYFHTGVFLPEYSAKLAYDLELVDTDLPFEQAQEKFLINSRAEKYANDPNFSLKIRQTD